MNFIKKLLGQKDIAEGETSEFKAFLQGSMEGLRLQTDAHRCTWHLGEEESWDFSQDTEELVFTFPNVIVRARAQIIGTFDSLSKTWMWSWVNPSISNSLTRDALRVREYGEAQHIKRLTTPKWPAEEMDAWQMTALANRLCESNGAYRGPADSTFVFITFRTIQLKKKE
jgi:hypothetical protein